tara:strand:- start:19 stop:414 length:396 start_codon:yes stop_codon:yes gene_type:complete
MTNKIFWIVSLVAVLVVGSGIEKPFWQDEIYQQKIIEVQKEGNYLPYRVRKVLWNRLVIIKTVVERSVNLLWFQNFLGIGGVTLWRGILKKRWREMSLFLFGVILISIEKDMNPGFYFWFLFPSIWLVWSK